MPGGSSLRGLPLKGLSLSGSSSGEGPSGSPPISREGHNSSAGISVVTSPSAYIFVMVTIVGDIIGEVHMCSGMGASYSH